MEPPWRPDGLPSINAKKRVFKCFWQKAKQVSLLNSWRVGQERERETAGGAGNGERMRTGRGTKTLQNACPCFWGPALGERLGRRIAAVVLGPLRPGIANTNGFVTLAL